MPDYEAHPDGGIIEKGTVVNVNAPQVKDVVPPAEATTEEAKTEETTPETVTEQPKASEETTEPAAEEAKPEAENSTEGAEGSKAGE
jgi:hypothetical protein